MGTGKIGMASISTRGIEIVVKVREVRCPIKSMTIPNVFVFFSFLRTEYLDPEIIITENGWSDNGEVEDSGRIEYLRVHLKAVLLAIGDGCNVTAHTTWSIMDNFEWLSGYS